MSYNTDLSYIVNSIDGHIKGLSASNQNTSGISSGSMRIEYGYQLLFDVTNYDIVTRSLDSYKAKLKKELRGKFHEFIDLVFTVETRNDAIDLLTQLSAEYNANLTPKVIERMLRDVNLKVDFFYIVVVILPIPIVVN